MSLVVNHNLMAANTARNLNAHYGRLQTSTQRLSSGLRVNSAADDAAGLAIRELQRADIAALQQGARNANDAISMIQTADGALGIIDEKLIRMKELAEQAATGTYDSTQRLMIESEYQAMASEITRIANATDFNGMKLLDGTLSSDEHDGSGLTATGKMKIHFGTGNDSAEDYYYITIGDCRASAFGVGNESTWDSVINRAGNAYGEYLKAQLRENDPANEQYLSYYVEGFKNALTNATVPTEDTYEDIYAKYLAISTTAKEAEPPVTFWNSQAAMPSTWDEYQKLSSNQQQKVQYAIGQAIMYDMNANGPADSNGILEANLNPPQDMEGKTLTYIDADGDEQEVPAFSLKDADGNDDADATTAAITDALKNVYTKTGHSDYAGFTVETQEDAQHALDAINEAIVSKDKIRAHLGSTQNRLENTITNLNVQAENLQAAESRISDVDVATEMTQFVRNQILTQSAVAMLGQANSLPQMAMQLIGG